MSITGIISAIGNTKSICPLFVRDCCIEIPTKVKMTYDQNKSDKNVKYLATRERLVDEYATSAVWLGGIPLIEKICKTIIKSKGFNPDIDIKLLKENNLQGLNRNIKEFETLTPEAVRDLKFLKKNKQKYMKLIGGKVFAESVIPMLLMGFVIPKLIFAWTASTKNKLEETKGANFKKSSKMASPTFAQKQVFKYESMNDFMSRLKNNQNNKKSNQEGSKENVNFKGNLISNMAEFSTLQKMLVTDGGYSAGRVITARNGFAALDTGFKMMGMLYLNFLFPDQLAGFLNKSISKLADTNINLDIKMLDDKDFVEAVKNNKLNLPKAKTDKELLKFIDENPDSLFVQYAKKFKKLKFLKNGIRDPRSYVDFEELNKFRENIAQTAEKAVKSKDVAKFIKKAKFLKGFSILANVAISSFLLAWGLPKAQFAVRKAVTKCDLEPGILD